MKILLAGPLETSSLRNSLQLKLEGAPPGTVQTPLGPLAGALMKKGITLHIVTLDPSIEAPISIEEQGFRIDYVPLRGAPRYRARVRMKDLFAKEIAGLVSVIRAANPDLVHAHWTYEYAEAAVRSGLQHLVTMHDIGWQNVFLYRDLYRCVRLAMMLRVMPRIRYLIIVSPFMKVHARLHGYLGPVDVIPNGVEIPSGYRQSTTICNSQPIRIVSVGDATRRKNILATVNAYEVIKGIYPNAELHLFGPGLDRQFVGGKAGITGHGAVPHSILMDFLDNQATILVHPSVQETFGVILAEAMLRNVPVVAGLKSGLSFVTDAGRVAKLVDVRAPACIGDAVINLLRNKDETEAQEKAAREYTIDKFDVKRVADKYIKIYKDIIYGNEVHEIVETEKNL